MKLEIKNYFGETVELVPKVALYSVKDFMGKELPGLAVLLETTDGYPYADLTVSFGEFIGLKNCAYVDTNNCDFASQILEQGVARETGFHKTSGFCPYPLWEFSEDFLRAAGEEAYQKYSDAYDAYMQEDDFSEEDEGGMVQC